MGQISGGSSDHMLLQPKIRLSCEKVIVSQEDPEDNGNESRDDE